VACAEALGHQHLDRLADHLAARVAEDALHLGVDQHDAPAFVHQDHAGGRRLDRLAEQLARAQELRHSAGNRAVAHEAIRAVVHSRLFKRGRDPRHVVGGLSAPWPPRRRER
jgi:hypothetical protein